MKRMGLVTIGLCVTLMIGGCSSREEEEAEPAYDPALDGPVATVEVEVDYGILEDQQQLAAQYADAGGTSGRTGGTPTTAPPAGEPVEAVQATVQRMIEVADSEDPARLASFFAADIRPKMEELLGLVQRVQAKAEKANELITQQLQVQAPEEIARMAGGSGPDLAGRFENKTAESFNYSLQDGKVIVTATDIEDPMVFVKSDDGWKVEAPEQMAQGLDMFIGMIKPGEQLLDALIAGINDGSITAENLQSKIQELKRELPATGQDAGSAPASSPPTGDGAAF